MGKIGEIQLRQLYLSKKLPSKKVAAVLNCSEHKVNYWLSRYNIPKRSISEAIYNQNNPTGDPFQIKSIQSLKDAELFGLGLGLYWGEGNKKNKNAVRLGNTDPKLIKKWLEFLVKILGVRVHKIRCGLQIFNDMSKKDALIFWLKELKDFGVTEKNFFGITVTPARSIGNYREKSKYGVLTIHFCNIKLKKILDSMLPM